jgi:phenylalanyl-tRNA synthetase beta chain
VLTVETMEHVGATVDGVVVAKVLDLRPHPDADKIQLVDVDAGDGEPLQVACGAFNMAVGDVVPLATSGTTMPDGRLIERRKLRGEWSNGMLCSGAELGLTKDAGGILILPGNLPLGMPLAEAMGIEADVLYDLEVNPNRPDAMSVAGVARDLAARVGVPFTMPDPAPPAPSGSPAADRATIEIVDTDLCGRFVGRVLTGIAIGPSPAWVATRLTLLGMRPINNVVDASNYVMLELGQPNHAYDLARLAGRGLRVRRAHPGESLTTLDDVERTFTAEDLLICDAHDRAVGIAGVMGGADTEIGPATTDVLLELAWFDPMSIARTARRLGLRTEASARFERGCDWEAIDRAADRFAELLAASTPIAVAPGSIDERGRVPDRSPVRLRTSRTNQLLGTGLSDADIKGLLDPIGFTATPVDPGVAEVALPTWRLDTAEEVDLVEEVARHYGYHRLPRTVRAATEPGGLTERQRERRLVRDVMVGLGVSEAMPMPFLGPGDLERSGLDPDGLRIANPLVAEQSILRTSLLPGLVQSVAYNVARRTPEVDLFEIGHVYRRPPSGQLLPDEREWLGVVLGGRDARAAKEVWDVLAEALVLDDVALVAADDEPGTHPTRTARVVVRGEPVGVVGEVDPAVLAAHDVEERVGWLEIDLDRLLDLPHRQRRYRPVSRFPSSDIDLAFIVPDRLPAAGVEQVVRAAGGDLLVDLRLFDVFRDASVLGEGRRGLAYRLRFQAADHTLTDEEVAEVRRRAIEAAESLEGVELRG